MSAGGRREANLLDELALREAALDAATCGVVIAAARSDNPILHVNQTFATITGHAPEDVIGRNCRFLTQGLSEAEARLNERPLAEVRKALRLGTSCEVTLRNRMKTGARFWNTLRLAAVRNAAGEVTHFIGVLEDVTRALDAVQAVADARDQLRAVLAAAPDAVMTIDAEQRITSFNRAAERLFGWSAEEIVGERIDHLIPKDLRARHEGLAARYTCDEHATAGSMAGERIILASRKDGVSFPAHVSLARYVHSGAPAVTVMAHDMSGVVEAQQALKEMSEGLAEQLKAVEAANNAKSQFLAVMNHEMRTPLNGVLGIAQLLKMTHLDSEQTELVDGLFSCGTSMLAVVEGLLDFTSMHSGRMQVGSAPVDLSTVIAEAVMTVSVEAREKRIAIEIDTDTGLEGRTIVTDGLRVRQVLTNLLVNALKFSDAGPIRIKACLLQPASEVCIEVSDQGIGIPADKHDYIFERFAQTDQGLARKYGGVGLGLSICREIVTALGGRIGVLSAEGQGSTFWFTLPFDRDMHGGMTLKEAGPF